MTPPLNLFVEMVQIRGNHSVFMPIYQIISNHQRKHCLTKSFSSLTVVITFQFSIEETNLLVVEGDIPGEKIGIKTDTNPQDLCPSGSTCSYLVKLEIIDNDRPS